ncbi:hypothetical protein [Vibrio phage JSF15]|uniref:Uncharacterized protein n=1 Tax=Vibrio phage JSF15 TaxID=1983598 RepID=A0A2D0YJV7_9CAUD|nr:hypothetical protein [Vibrio phage JSF15]
MTKFIVTCPSLDNVKPNITAVAATGTETVDSLVGDNQIAIIIGGPIAGRASLDSNRIQVVARALADYFCSEARLGEGVSIPAPPEPENP